MSARHGSVAAPAPPHWSLALRALREARAVTQAGFAAQLGVGSRTVQRWEWGTAVPDAHGEAALLAYCAARGLNRRFEAGALAGVSVTPTWVRDLLAGARVEVGNSGAAQPAE